MILKSENVSGRETAQGSPLQPVRLVCPACQGSLSKDETHVQCLSCGSTFVVRDGFPELLIGERYTDPISSAEIQAEEETLRLTTERYWIPLFRQFWPDRSWRPKILSLGCGVGTDVELLCQNGFDAMGIDCGERVSSWQRRQYPERFVLANGMHLPFESGTFDAIYCGCVFPHIGVVGSSYNLQPDFRKQRLALAREMARVTRPSGKIIAASPNRHFPFDIFHEHTQQRFRARLTMPWDPLLLSRRDYEDLFRQAGFQKATGLPVEKYWSFAHSRKTLKGRLLGAPVRFIFWFVSRPPCKLLRTSFLNPWIVVLVQAGRELPRPIDAIRGLP